MKNLELYKKDWVQIKIVHRSNKYIIQKNYNKKTKWIKNNVATEQKLIKILFTPRIHSRAQYSVNSSNLKKIQRQHLFHMGYEPT